MKDNRPSLDDEIEKFINFIDGEIISYDEPDGNKGAELEEKTGLVNKR